MVMILILALVLIAAIAVIGGLFFLIKNESEKSPQKDAVPITDVSELKRQMSVEEEQTESPHVQSPSMDELSQVKAKLADLEKDKPAQQEISATPGSVGDIRFSKILTDEGPVAVSGSPSEIGLTEKIMALESEVQAISAKAIRQAEDAVRVIETLNQENEALRAAQSVTHAGVDGDLNKLILELREKNNILSNQLELGTAKIAQLETQLAVVRKEMGQQLLEANASVARLKAESEAQGRVSQESLLAEKKELDEWKEKTSVQIREMETALASAKEEGLLLKDTKKLLEAKLAVLEDDFNKQLNDAKAIINTLTLEKQNSQARTDELEQNIAKLKELNATLIDKAKILQFELNRQRAQATGMERVCNNFKTQLEELFQTVEKAKKDNERLLQERAAMESGMASLKSEHSRLLEKDRVSQLELQKTKEQMNRFSKIYDNFKSNLKDVSDEN